MSKQDDGGQAFPNPPDADANWTRPGMSLRDYFAAKAMLQAWSCEEEAPTHGKEPSYRGTAERAYLFADAMIKAREA